MSVLAWIVLTTAIGAVMSVCAAAAFALRASPARISSLISYAVGALLGAVFLEILPHAVEATENVRSLTLTVLLGILAFFILEKLILWRHCHSEICEVHEVHEQSSDHGRSGLMILIGDTVHNFVDGILIAAAFLIDIELGIVTAVAIIAHEIPQEVGDFLVLLHSGYSRAKAFAFNLLSSAATLVGGLLAYAALQSLESWISTLLGIAAASMIYVAIADLIPGLHRRTELRATLEQVLLIGAGIASIALVKAVLGHALV
jgi:zinc and cadmium transporter